MNKKNCEYQIKEGKYYRCALDPDKESLYQNKCGTFSDINKCYYKELLKEGRLEELE